MKDSLQRTSGDVRPLVDRTKTFRLVAYNLQMRRHVELAGVIEQEPKHEQQRADEPDGKVTTQRPLAVKMNSSPALYIPTSSLGPGLSRPPQRRGDGGYPPSLGLFLEGGLVT